MDQTRLDAIRARCDEFLEWLEDGTEFREIEKHGKALSIDVLDMIDEVARLTAELAATKAEYKVALIDRGEALEMLAAMKAERDAWKARCEAAEQDLKDLVKYQNFCHSCKHFVTGYQSVDEGSQMQVDDCRINKCEDGESWEWRGPVEGGEGKP